jgi:hypothetical protein
MWTVLCYFYQFEAPIACSQQSSTNACCLQGKEGVVVVKTTQALLIAHYPETVQPGVATNTVEQLGDYLIGLGY